MYSGTKDPQGNPWELTASSFKTDFSTSSGCRCGAKLTNTIEEVQTTQFSTTGLTREAENPSSHREGVRTERRALESWAQRGALPGGLGGRWAPLGCALSRGLRGQMRTVRCEPLCRGLPSISLSGYAPWGHSSKFREMDTLCIPALAPQNHL